MPGSLGPSLIQGLGWLHRPALHKKCAKGVLEKNSKHGIPLILNIHDFLGLVWGYVLHVCRLLFLLQEFPVGNVTTCEDESDGDDIADQLAMEIIDDYCSGAARL